MPEVFDHFFRLLGTSAAEQLDLITLDPGYRVYFEGDAEPDRHPRRPRGEHRAPSRAIEPGAGRALERYLDSATTTYDDAVERFLYTTFAVVPAVPRPRRARSAAAGSRDCCSQPLDSSSAGYVKDTRLRQILGYPAVFLGSSPERTPSMYHLMSHLDLADGVLYPQGGFTHRHRRDRRASRASRASRSSRRRG